VESEAIPATTRPFRQLSNLLTTPSEGCQDINAFVHTDCAVDIEADCSSTTKDLFDLFRGMQGTRREVPQRCSSLTSKEEEMYFKSRRDRGRDEPLDPRLALQRTEEGISFSTKESLYTARPVNSQSTPHLRWSSVDDGKSAAGFIGVGAVRARPGQGELHKELLLQNSQTPARATALFI
jgi:hypothetical protein